MKNLVIVESPSKAKTIEKYLGKEYKVLSSKGHIRDLAKTGKYGLGVDIQNDFKPTYEIIKGKNKIVAELKKEVKNSDKIFLASDPDREGEAISWHLKDALQLKDQQYERVIFNEITKNVVVDAIEHPRKIDEDLVRSQESRRILDRMIGFRLSKLMQSKTGGKSAGRVQSVALKLIVDREKEIESFITEEYWTLTAHFKDFNADLDSYLEDKIEIKNEIDATKILNQLSNAYKIEDVSKKAKKKQSKFPFTTSTLQQDASTKLGFNAKKTMSIAQKLYEGIDMGVETAGLITYMRTDSIRLSDEFIKTTFAYIEANYGKEYLGFVKKTKKQENVQDAHEAIRPTNINNHPDKIKPYLSADEYKLYKMIYYRTLASLMSDAKMDQTTIILDNNNYKFKATGSTLTFDGYLKVYQDYEQSEENELPKLDKHKSNILVSINTSKDQHFTKPPARYTEAKLIKELEELGIGRPSTYAKTMETLTERDYVKIVEKKFQPTTIGIETTEKLQQYFSDLINVKYTAEMESDLDKVAEGKMIWYKLLSDFYQEFEPTVQHAFDNMEKKRDEETGELCPVCGSSLVIKRSKYGTFTACSNYPTCKYIKQEKKEIKEIVKCPKCDGMIIEKKTKKGKLFYGCNRYPKCDFALWDKPTGEYCPECNSLLVQKGRVIKCSQCNYVKENE